MEEQSTFGDVEIQPLKSQGERIVPNPYPSHLSIHSEDDLSISSEGDLLLKEEHGRAQPKFPDKRFLFPFPQRLESLFRTFDDAIIEKAQSFQHKLLLYWNIAMTGLVAVEISLVVPVSLFMLGYDGLATEYCYLAIMLCFISQIPKRFLWRWRPYIVHRAQKMREDDTSSFPSRAVTCSVVFTFAICWGKAYGTDSITISWWMPVVVVLAVLLSSYARIYLGVHYPSDCLFGAIQGSLICLIGTALWDANVLGCTSCHYNKCYATQEAQEITGHHLSNINFVVIVVSSVVCIVIFLVSMAKPVVFWEKCDRVYSVLFACIVFQLSFLCPPASHHGSSLPQPAKPTAISYFAALLVPILVLPFSYVIGKKFKGRWEVLVFFVLFIPLTCLIAIWRLFVLGYANAS